MSPLHHVLNRIHAWNEQGYTFKSVICSRATNLGVSTPLSVLAVAQNTIAIPFAAAGTAAKMIVKPVAWISGSKALNHFDKQLPGITDLLLRIANIIRYVFATAANATLGVLSPSANFKAQCALGTTYDKQAVIKAVQELARRAAEAELAAAAIAAQQAAEEAKRAEQEAAAAAAKKAAEQAEAARKAAEIQKLADQTAAEATKKAAEKAAAEAAKKTAEQAAAAEATRKAAEQAEAARKAAEQAIQAAKNAADTQTTEIEVTDELEASNLLTQLMEDDEYEIEEEILPTAKQANWLSKLLAKIKPRLPKFLSPTRPSNTQAA